MKKWTSFLSLFILYLFIANPVQADAAERVLVGYESPDDLEWIEGVAEDVHHTYEGIDAVSLTVDAEQKQMLGEHPGVEWMESDQKVKTSSQKATWGYEALAPKASRSWGLTGKGRKVAVIDTGIAKNHPDLSVKAGISVLEDGGSWADDNGHGTHVAGVLAAKDNEIGVVGVAPDADLYAVKALDREGNGWESEIIAGIDWAVKQKVDVINLSLTSCKPSKSMKGALDHAEDKGVIVVAASGNGVPCDGKPLNDVMYPARYDNVVSVGAVNQRKSRALFSYGGESLDLVAPGTSILSTYIKTQDTPDMYESMSGTSMAAPFVSGVFLQAKQAFPSKGMSGLKQYVESHAVDLGAAGKDQDYGFGLVQAVGSPFTDVATGSWYVPYVQELYREGTVNGVGEGKFLPLGEISREEVVTMIGRTIGLDGTKRKTTFPDVDPDSFGSGYIDSAVDAGIIKGLPGGIFGPTQKITRGEVAVIIQRAYDLPAAEDVYFTDVPEDNYSYDALQAAKEAGILEGKPGGKSGYADKITRAELAAILARMDD